MVDWASLCWCTGGKDLTHSRFLERSVTRRCAASCLLKKNKTELSSNKEQNLLKKQGTIVFVIWQMANPDIRNIVLHQPLPNIKPQSALFRKFLIDKTRLLLEIQSYPCQSMTTSSSSSSPVLVFCMSSMQGVLAGQDTIAIWCLRFIGFLLCQLREVEDIGNLGVGE